MCNPENPEIENAATRQFNRLLADKLHEMSVGRAQDMKAVISRKLDWENAAMPLLLTLGAKPQEAHSVDLDYLACVALSSPESILVSAWEEILDRLWRIALDSSNDECRKIYSLIWDDIEEVDTMMRGKTTAAQMPPIAHDHIACGAVRLDSVGIGDTFQFPGDPDIYMKFKEKEHDGATSSNYIRRLRDEGLSVLGGEVLVLKQDSTD